MEAMTVNPLACRVSLAFVVALGTLPLFAADQPTPAAEEYTLVYKYHAGEVVQSKVTHLVTVQTKIKGVEQIARTRSISTKSWKIESIDADGNIRFTHQVDDVDMWQSVTGRPEVKYNSQQDKTPPQGYEHVADSVGKPLATVTITPNGRELKEKRESAQKQFNPGIGELTVPLPEKPVKIGAEWNMPTEIALKDEDGVVKKINLRQVYRLLKVETGVATIQVESQVITPLKDAKMQTELVQRLQNGTVRFDIDAGRLLLKQMDMNENILGFNGADSSMHYVARFSEEMSTAEKVARKE